MKEKYNNKIYFAQALGKNDIVCFKASVDTILNDAWYAERELKDESQRIVETAGTLIQIEIRRTNFDISTHPENEMIESLESDKQWVPPLLQVLLQSLTNNMLRQASLGQAIVYAARPISVLPPILFLSAVELDHLFGSKWLLTQLNRLGFCLSAEVLRYNQSVVMNENMDDLLKSISKGSFSQWSADNVDHNVHTINGKGNLHGMGIIISTTNNGTEKMLLTLPPVTRQKRYESSDLIKDKGIPIYEYEQNNIGLANLYFEELQNIEMFYVYQTGSFVAYILLQKRRKTPKLKWIYAKYYKR